VPQPSVHGHATLLAIHALLTALKHAMLERLHNGREDALLGARDEVETHDFGGSPLPFRFAACLHIRRSNNWTQTKGKRYHSDWFDEPGPALKYRRLLENVKVCGLSQAKFSEEEKKFRADALRRLPPAAKDRLAENLSGRAKDFRRLRLRKKSPLDAMIDVRGSSVPAPPLMPTSPLLPTSPMLPTSPLLPTSPCCVDGFLTIEDVSSQVRRNVLACLTAPLADRLERLGRLGLPRLQYRHAVQAEIGSSLRPKTGVPAWFEHQLRQRRVPARRVQALWEAAVQHRGMFQAVDSLLPELIARQCSGEPLLRPADVHSREV